MARRTFALALVLLAGCAAAPPPAPEEPRVLIAAQTDEPSRPEPARPREPPIGAPTIDPCEHARRCCYAVIESLSSTLPPGTVSPGDACASTERISELPGAIDVCKQMIRAWRDALEASSQAIPAACGGP